MKRSRAGASEALSRDSGAGRGDGRQREELDDCDVDYFYNGAVAAVAEGRHSVAVDLFSKAILLSRSDDGACARALEGRAVCWEKLGRLESAQEDARAIIARRPTLCNGYLRLGKILRLRGENERALQIYAIGAKRCPSDGAVFSRQILACRSTTATKANFGAVAAGASFNLFEDLPVEIVEAILPFIDAKSQRQVFQSSFQGVLFRYFNERASRAIKFVRQGSSISKTIEAIAKRPPPYLRMIECTSSNGLAIIMKQFKEGRFGKITALSIVGLDLCHITSPRIFLRGALCRLRLTGCSVGETFLSRLVSDNAMRRLEFISCTIAAERCEAGRDENGGPSWVIGSSLRSLVLDRAAGPLWVNIARSFIDSGRVGERLCTLRTDFLLSCPDMPSVHGRMGWEDPHFGLVFFKAPLEGGALTKRSLRVRSLAISSINQVPPASLGWCENLTILQPMCVGELVGLLRKTLRLITLHILAPFSAEDLVHIAGALPRTLQEVGMHHRTSLGNSISTNKIACYFLEGEGGRRRRCRFTLCFPRLGLISAEQVCQIRRDNEDSIIIVDQATSMAMAQRFWQIRKEHMC